MPVGKVFLQRIAQQGGLFMDTLNPDVRRLSR